MTEFWVSQSNKWCDVCRVWLKDSAQSWAVHERGIKHKENVARKLREMRQKTDKEKKDAADLEATMAKVEAEAAQRYEADRKAEEAARAAADAAKRAALGSWEWNEGSGYYYNAVQRWYYDTGSGMYYGGEPAAWTDEPSIPREARYEVMNAPPPKPAAAPAAAAAAAGSSGSGSAAAGGATRPPGQQQYAVAGSRIVNKHPLSEVGGYQLHSIQGAVGGAKGVGTLSRGGGAGAAAGAPAVSAAAAGAADPKRKREGGQEKELSREEREFLARREAARARVQQRTAATFGLT